MSDSDVTFILEKKFAKAVCDILKKIKKDSGLSHPFVYFNIKNKVLTISRFNRTACIFIDCNQIPLGVSDVFNYVGKLSFIDFSDIVKSSSSDITFSLSSADQRLEISSVGGSYKYTFKPVSEDELNGWESEPQTVSLFSLHSGVVRVLTNSLLVTPLGRTPACLDSIMFDGKIAYSTDIGVMASLDVYDLVVPSDWLGGAAMKDSVTSHLHMELTTKYPIPAFLFEVCEYSPEICTIEFGIGKNGFSSVFEVPEYCSVRAYHKKLDGNYPLPIAQSSFETSKKMKFGRFEVTKMRSAIKKIKAISKNDNIVNIRGNKDELFFSVEFNEKSGNAFISRSDSNDLFAGEDDDAFLSDMSITYRAVANDILLALKPIEDIVQFGISDNLLVVKDLWRTYILPAQ